MQVWIVLLGLYALFGCLALQPSRPTFIPGVIPVGFIAPGLPEFERVFEIRIPKVPSLQSGRMTVDTDWKGLV